MFATCSGTGWKGLAMPYLLILYLASLEGNLSGRLIIICLNAELNLTEHTLVDASNLFPTTLEYIG